MDASLKLARKVNSAKKKCVSAFRTMLTKFEGFTRGNEILHKYANRWGKLSFGVAIFDRLTNGGVPMRGIFELAGDPGSGKTQIALKLALSAQRQVRGSSVVYICTEHMFPSGRLVQMEAEYKRLNLHDEMVRHHNFIDNVLVEHVRCVPKLSACLFDRLPVLLENTPVSLLIIDSITSPFLDEQDYVSRAQTFRTIAHRLQLLQERHNFAIVVTNQVRAVIDSSTLADERNIPALGLAWSTLVHTRVQLSRLSDTRHKLCSVLFGPTVTPGQGFFQINDSGPADIPDSSPIVSPFK